jgi:hypothetical protein
MKTRRSSLPQRISSFNKLSTFSESLSMPALDILRQKEKPRGEIEATDQAIDSLVYEFYGLTEAGINIVEAG